MIIPLAQFFQRVFLEVLYSSLKLVFNEDKLQGLSRFGCSWIKILLIFNNSIFLLLKSFRIFKWIQRQWSRQYRHNKSLQQWPFIWETLRFFVVQNWTHLNDIVVFVEKCRELADKGRVQLACWPRVNVWFYYLVNKKIQATLCTLFTGWH